MTQHPSLPRSNGDWPRRGGLWCLTMRLHLLLPAWACAFTGGALASGTDTTCRLLLSPTRATGGLIAWSLALVAIHMVNLVTDRQGDVLNCKNLFWQAHLPARHLLRLAVVMAMAALLLAGGIGKAVFCGVGMTLVLGAAYSAPPFRLSHRWGWDLAANALGYGLLAPWLGAALWASQGQVPSWPWPAIRVLVPLVGAVFLWTTLLDRHGDAVVGKQTFAVRWGRPVTLATAAGLAVLAALMSWIAPYVSLNQSGQVSTELACYRGVPVATIWACSLSVVALLALVALVLIWRRRETERLLSWLPTAITGGVVVAALPALLRWPILGSLALVWWLICQGCQTWIKHDPAGT